MGKYATLKFPDECNAETRPFKILHMQSDPVTGQTFAEVEYTPVYEYYVTWWYLSKKIHKSEPFSVEFKRAEGWEVYQTFADANADVHYLLRRELLSV